MAQTNYKKLLASIKRSPYKCVNPFPCGWTEVVLYANKKDLSQKKPTFTRLLNPQKNGQAFLRSPSGKIIMIAKVFQGKLHGRAKMYNEDGTFVGNTYWCREKEINSQLSADFFHPFEEKEKKLIENSKKEGKLLSEQEKDQIYESEGFYSGLEIYAVLSGISSPNKNYPLPFHNKTR